MEATAGFRVEAQVLEIRIGDVGMEREMEATARFRD